MKIGNLDVTGIFVGDTEVYKAYLGDVIVYEKSVSVEAVEFTANAASTVGLASLSTNQTLEYSTDGTTWNTMDTSTTINLASGSSVYVRGQLSGNNSTSDYTQFTMTGSIAASGGMNYIWNKNNPESTTLSFNSSYCGYMMFANCAALTTPPELPSTTLRDGCYRSMFAGCSSLTTAPELPATTLALWSYDSMFQGCTNLTSAPSELPATTLGQYCCQKMFQNCTSLTTAPELPATTLSDGCYNSMFQGCTSLTSAPKLPATTLRGGCYGSMFYGCTSLTTAPELPATTLTGNCYYEMFRNCTSLNYIKCLATDISNNAYNWVRSVSATGTFVKNPLMSSWTRGSSGIPSSWTVIDEPFMFKANAASTVGLASLSSNQTLEYSTDGTTWTSMDTNTTINLASGDTVYVRGQLSGNNSTSDYTQFTMTGSIAASGSANYLWDYTNSDATTLSYSYCGYNMFRGCSSLTTAPTLPATTLTTNCYYGMFFGCTSLTSAQSVLPATTLKQSCYRQMFYGCSSLTTAPEIPATTVANVCCRQMFEGCTSLTSAPSELPATTLADNCYSEMFTECSNITTAPELPATTLTSNCYNKMFYNCRSLNYIKCLATDISATDCTTNWVFDVSATGTFVKDSTMTSWGTGNSGIPSNWTVQNA